MRHRIAFASPSHLSSTWMGKFSITLFYCHLGFLERKKIAKNLFNTVHGPKNLDFIMDICLLLMLRGNKGEANYA